MSTWKNDNFKNRVRKDSQTAHFDIIEILISLDSIPSLRLFCIDMKVSYSQRGPILRETYVYPLQELCEKQKSF